MTTEHVGNVLVHRVTKNFFDSAIILNLLGGADDLFIGIAAMLNPSAFRTSVLCRRSRPPATAQF
ncbi:hypothetical protein [Rhizobium lusitanum]|uniref:hypothetical protein n=1 Tax=Rhizobium lusitanum TaxID=293958 RepID=UPI0015724213|nr:hypothetical protein [Rhizobium lusitanum]